METIYVKNMVCNRCIMVVQNELTRIGLHIEKISLGEVKLNDNLTGEKITEIEKVLTPLGFELIDDKKSRLIEQIKNIIINHIHHQNNKLNTNLSELISSELNHDYNYLSNTFSEVEGTTIEKYFIAQRIEKVKELLVYDELTLSEIAHRLNYSSVAYLSNQFRKITGLTPSHFKKIGNQKRKPIDKV